MASCSTAADTTLDVTACVRERERARAGGRVSRRLRPPATPAVPAPRGRARGAACSALSSEASASSGDGWAERKARAARTAPPCSDRPHVRTAESTAAASIQRRAAHSHEERTNSEQNPKKCSASHSPTRLPTSTSVAPRRSDAHRPRARHRSRCGFSRSFRETRREPPDGEAAVESLRKMRSRHACAPTSAGRPRRCAPSHTVGTVNRRGAAKPARGRHCVALAVSMHNTTLRRRHSQSVAPPPR